MEYIPEIYFRDDEYRVTNTGNIVSWDASISGSHQVEIPGGKCIIKKGVVIRGDLAPVRINRYTIIGENTVLHPSYTTLAMSKVFEFIPITIGKFTQIGANCVIESAVIGLGCVIEDDCVLSPRTILKDHVLVMKV